jgi:hypothetical protein
MVGIECQQLLIGQTAINRLFRTNDLATFPHFSIRDARLRRSAIFFITWIAKKGISST